MATRLAYFRWKAATTRSIHASRARRCSVISLKPSLSIPAGRPKSPTARTAAAPPISLPAHVIGVTSPYPTVDSVALEGGRG